jgi:hypothetical protein
MPEGGHWKPERVVIIEFPDTDAAAGVLHGALGTAEQIRELAREAEFRLFP